MIGNSVFFKISNFLSPFGVLNGLCDDVDKFLALDVEIAAADDAEHVFNAEAADELRRRSSWPNSMTSLFLTREFIFLLLRRRTTFLSGDASSQKSNLHEKGRGKYIYSVWVAGFFFRIERIIENCSLLLLSLLFLPIVGSIFLRSSFREIYALFPSRSVYKLNWTEKIFFFQLLYFSSIFAALAWYIPRIRGSEKPAWAKSGFIFMDSRTTSTVVGLWVLRVLSSTFLSFVQ